MKALVLVKFVSLEAREAYRSLQELSSVVEAYTVFGRFDAIAVIEAKHLDDIRRILLTEVQTIPGVIETMPLLFGDDPGTLEAKGRIFGHDLANPQHSSL
jgi:DNA-binding Lrp family transcriptional regulator